MSRVRWAARGAAIGLAAVHTTLAARSADAQDLARRVAAAPDGLVMMTYAVRDGVCGDGRTFIADGAGGDYAVWFHGGMSIHSTNSGDFQSRCAAGPARVMLVLRERRVVDVQPFVGPPSAATERASTNLGVVSAPDAARYLLDLARRGSGDARDAFLAAGIADSARIAQPLADMARDRSLRTEVRSGSLRWLARAAEREGSRDALAVARRIAEDTSDATEIRDRAIRVIAEEPDGPAYLRTLYPRLDETTLRERVIRTMSDAGSRSDLEWVRGVALDSRERLSVRERAVRVLGESHDARALRELYDRLDDPSLRDRVIRAAAEHGSSESRQWLRGIVENRTEQISLRERAVRSLAELGDYAYLRSAYGTVGDAGLRERILRPVADGGGAEVRQWLRTIVRDDKESAGLRDRAVRSLAESGAPTTELVSLYDAVDARPVRERLITLLAERGDRTARDKLRAIADQDEDEGLRRRALRRLEEGRS